MLHKILTMTLLVAALILVACAPSTPPPTPQPIIQTVPVLQTVIVPQTVVVTPLPAPTATAAPTATSAVPTIPATVAVTLDAKTSALLILDITSVICTPRRTCMASLPALTALLKKARDAKVPVVYSDTPTAGSTILPEVAQLPNEPKVTGRADKFINTNLDDILKGLGTKNAVIVGSASNGAVLYTSFGANIRGFNVVVVEDGMSTDDAFAQLLTRYQLLNQPGFANAANTPPQEGRIAVTLTRSDQITFK